MFHYGSERKRERTLAQTIEDEGGEEEDTPPLLRKGNEDVYPSKEEVSRVMLHIHSQEGKGTLWEILSIFPFIHSIIAEHAC